MDTQTLNTMKQKDLAIAVTQLAAIANKRAKRLSESVYGSSSALVSFERSGGKAGSRGKTFNELRREFARVQQFLNAKTSTIKGAKQVQKETSERLGSETKNWTTEDWKQFWNTYNKIKDSEDTRIALYRLGSDKLQQLLRDQYIQGEEQKTILERINELSLEYDEEEEFTEGQIDESFFDLWGNNS